MRMPRLALMTMVLVQPRAVHDLEEEDVPTHAVLVEPDGCREPDEQRLRKGCAPVSLDGAPHGAEGMGIDDE